MTKEDFLKQCTVVGNVVKVPAEKVDKKIFDEAKKALGKIGGTWKGGKVFGFEFEKDPTDLLAEISSGVKRDIKKEFQFYATPQKLAKKLVGYANIQETETILEPSAGRASILEAINSLGLKLTIHCCELMEDNREILLKRMKELKFNLVGDDFLLYEPKVSYDKIIANPPFTNNQDIRHIRKMYDLLNDCGQVVSISSTSWIQTLGKESTAFRRWLDDDGYFTDDRNAPLLRQWHVFGNTGTTAQFQRKNGDTVSLEMIEAKEFKESGVNVKTCIISIDRYTGI